MLEEKIKRAPILLHQDVFFKFVIQFQVIVDVMLRVFCFMIVRPGYLDSKRIEFAGRPVVHILWQKVRILLFLA